MKYNSSDENNLNNNSKKYSINKNYKYVDIYSAKKRKKKKVSWKKIVSFSFFLILGIVGSAMLYIYKTLHSFHYDDLNNSDVEQVSDDNQDSFDYSDLINDSMVLNTLLIGSDSMSVGDGGRSDSMILMSVDARHKKIKLTSFMRDIWVTIPAHGQDRLNASYAYGGPKLTLETLERNFGIHIDRYVVVDFNGFANIVDTLGGVDIELTSAECAYINKYSGDKHTLRGSGMKHLTGLQALNYARDRNSIGSDFDRTSRQRITLRAISDKLKSANAFQIAEIVSKLGPSVTTNFKSSEINGLARHALTYLSYPIEEFRLPTDDNYRNETYSQKMVLVINNMEKAKKDLSNFIYERDIKLSLNKESFTSKNKSVGKATTSNKRNNITTNTKDSMTSNTTSTSTSKTIANPK